MPRCGNCRGHHPTSQMVKDCYAGRLTSRVVEDVQRAEAQLGPSKEEVAEAVSMFQEELTRDAPRIAKVLGTDKPKRSAVPAHLRREAKKEHGVKMTDFETPNLMGKEVMDGRYAVILDGEQVTLRFHVPTMGKWKGRQLVEYLMGPDNTMDGDWMRFGNRLEGGFRIWGRFIRNEKLLDAVRHMMGATKDELVSAGEAYALASSNCWRCGRDLTREDSIIRGMGPVCADKVGL
jgi:Family of unknown function (DUF6011)